MPIKGLIDMLTTGIRTPIGIKIFGPDLEEIRKLGERLESVMRDIPGTRSVFAERTTGGYYLDIIPIRAQIARYGLNVEDVLTQVETSIGGMAIARTIEGRERYTINVRYSRELRDDVNKLKRVLVPVLSNASGGSASDGDGMAASGQAIPMGGLQQIPLGRLLEIKTTSGPPVIRNGNFADGLGVCRYGKRGRRRLIEEAKRAVAEKIAIASFRRDIDSNGRTVRAHASSQERLRSWCRSRWRSFCAAIHEF